MKFNEAKIALKRSKSVEDVRQAREKIENLGEEHHLPFEFPVASELLEVYLARKSLPFKKQAYARNFQNFLKRYQDQINVQEQTNTIVNEREVANMLGIDMLNIMRSYLLIPEKQVLVFPPVVRNVRQHAKSYLDFIDEVFTNNLQLELEH